MIKKYKQYIKESLLDNISGPSKEDMEKLFNEMGTKNYMINLFNYTNDNNLAELKMFLDYGHKNMSITFSDCVILNKLLSNDISPSVLNVYIYYDLKYNFGIIDNFKKRTQSLKNRIIEKVSYSILVELLKKGFTIPLELLNKKINKIKTNRFSLSSYAEQLNYLIEYKERKFIK